MTLRIQGHGDDIIGLGGDVSEEWYTYDREEDYVILPGDHVIMITRDNNSTWRITELTTGPHPVSVDRAVPGAEASTDLLTIHGPVAWAAHAVSFKPARV